MRVMKGTSLRVSEDTYKMVIRTRGIFEQLFRRKLSLDETIYLSSRLISFVYETIQRLQAQEKIKIVEAEDGSLELQGLENVREVLPEIISEFTDINEKLAEKEKAVQVAKIEKSGET